MLRDCQVILYFDLIERKISYKIGESEGGVEGGTGSIVINLCTT